MFFSSPLEVPLLAAATTFHLALAALVNHRHQGQRAFSPLAGVSSCLAASPWAFGTAAGVLGGFAAHVIWMAICFRLPVASSTAMAITGTRRSTPAVGSATTPPAADLKRSADGSRPKGFVQLPVLATIAETPDIKTFRLARPDGFDFVAGQFLTVRLRVDGREAVRCYSISSAPAARGYLEISVRRQGLVSNTLHALARPGSLLSARAPAGVFTYPGGDDRPLVLIGGGIGITPLMSMLRHAVLTEPTRPVALLYSARDTNDFGFRDELVLLARRHDRVRVCFAATRGVATPDVYPGRIDERLIATVVPDVRQAVTMICGPQGMIDGLTSTLTAMGVAADQVRSERFEAAVAASAGKTTAHDHEPATGDTFQIRDRRSARAVPAAPGQTLLEAADRHGLEIPSLCRAGVCGTCRTRVIEGDVSCDGGILDSDDRAAGYVLACVASPRSHCVIEVA